MGGERGKGRGERKGGRGRGENACSLIPSPSLSLSPPLSSLAPSRPFPLSFFLSLSLSPPPPTPGAAFDLASLTAAVELPLLGGRSIVSGFEGVDRRVCVWKEGRKEGRAPDPTACSG